MHDLHQMVLTFCEEERWACPVWKTLPHVRPLFELAEELQQQEEEDE